MKNMQNNGRDTGVIHKNNSQGKNTDMNSKTTKAEMKMNRSSLGSSHTPILSDDSKWLKMGEIAVMLTCSDPLERTLTRCLALCASSISADIITIFSYDEAESMMHVTASLGINPESIKPFKVAVGKDVSYYSENSGQKLFENAPTLLSSRGEPATEVPEQRVICLPMVFQENTIGLFVATKREGKVPFDFEDRKFAEAAASQFTLAVKSGIPSENIMERERMERTLQYAHTLQRCFRSDADVEIEGYDLTIKTCPSMDMGGDFHDVIELPEDKTAIIIGKTSGYGLEAGLNIGRTVSELRGALASTQSPAKALEKFNKTLAGQRRSSLMVNVSVMILDRKNKSLTYAGAGNSKVYMVDAESQSIELLDNCSASPVGIISDWNFSENKYEFSEESILFAHTDGLVRCVNENGEPVNQLMIDACMLESLKGGTPAAKIMLECLHDYSETPLFMDDITMISLAMKK